jgi:hypothetical protein
VSCLTLSETPPHFIISSMKSYLSRGGQRGGRGKKREGGNDRTGTGDAGKQRQRAPRDTHPTIDTARRWRGGERGCDDDDGRHDDVDDALVIGAHTLLRVARRRAHSHLAWMKSFFL